MRRCTAAYALPNASAGSVARITSSASAAKSLCASSTFFTATSAHSTAGSRSAGAHAGSFAKPSDPSEAAVAADHRSAAALAAPTPPAPTLPIRRNSQGYGGLASFSSASSSLSEPPSASSSSSSSASASRVASFVAVCSKTTVANVRFFTVCSARPSSTSTAPPPVPCSNTATQHLATRSRSIGPFVSVPDASAEAICEPWLASL